MSAKRHVPLRVRLLSLLFIFAVPLALIGIDFDEALRADIRVAQAEAGDARLFGQVLDLLNETADYRAIDIIAQAGEQTDEATSIAAHVQTILERLAAEPLAPHARVQALTAEWGSYLQSRGEGRSAAYQVFEHSIYTLVDDLARGSDIVLDPDPDSFWLFAAATTTLPRTIERVSALKFTILELLIANENRLPEERRSHVIALEEVLGDLVDQSIASIEASLAADQTSRGTSQTLQANLPPALADYRARHAALNSVLNGLLAGGTTTPDDFLAISDGLHDATASLASLALDEGAILLDRRIADVGAERLVALSKAALAVLAALLAYHFIANSLLRTIRAVRDDLGRLADGDTQIALKATGQKDEIGQLVGSLVELRGAVAEAYRLKQILDQLPVSVMTVDVHDEFRIDYMNQASRNSIAQIADKLPVPPDQLLGKSFDIFHKEPARQRRLVADPANLPHRARIRLGNEWMDLLVSAIRDRHGRYIGALNCWSVVTSKVKLAEDFEARLATIVTNLAGNARSVTETAERMQTAAGQTTEATATVSSAATQSNANMQTVASAAEELSSSSSEIARQIESVAARAGSAKEQAMAAQSVVADLSGLAGAIGTVAATIRDTADQTNLLALNATIEAARAGDAGKGFAVVADEVKKLAGQTAQRTDDIEAQIQRVQAAVDRTVKAVGSIIASVSDIDSASTSVASAITEQNAATAEINRNVLEVTAGSAQVAKSLLDVHGAAAEAGTTASTLLEAATSLTDQADTLREAADTFLSTLKAA